MEPLSSRYAWISWADRLTWATWDRIQVSKRLLAETDHLLRTDRVLSAREGGGSGQPPGSTPAGSGRDGGARDERNPPRRSAFAFEARRPLTSTPEHYEREALKAEALADRASTPEMRVAWRKVADQWRWVAEQRRSRPNPR
jgi:hypothetical protein